MNWDERLKDARARRAKIMESKGEASSLKKPPRLGPSRNEDAETPPPPPPPKPPKPVEQRQRPREIERPPVPQKSRRSGLVLVVFGAGILLGVGLMQFQGSSGPETRAPTEEVAARSPVEDTAVVEAAPAPTGQAIAQTPVEDDVPVEQPVAEATTEDAPRVEPSPEPADQVVAGLTPEDVVDEPVPEPAEQAVAGSTSDVATTLEPTPEPVEQGVSEVAVAPLTFVQVSVLSAPRADVSSFSAGVPATFTSPSFPPSLARFELFDADAVDAVPAVGAAPEFVAPDANTLEPEEAPEVLDTLASMSANDSDTLPDDAGTLPAIISDEGRAVQQLDDISRLDNAPASLESSLAPEIAGTDDVAAPSPIVTDGIVRPIWIFAPGSVSDEILETTRSTAENLNLSVQAINRVNFRISTNQVRYYDQTSSAAAEQLAARLDAVPRDFTTSGIDAQPGTLEVYLAGRSVGARSQNTASSQRSAPSNNASSLRESVIDRIRAGLGN